MKIRRHAAVQRFTFVLNYQVEQQPAVSIQYPLNQVRDAKDNSNDPQQVLAALFDGTPVLFPGIHRRIQDCPGRPCGVLHQCKGRRGGGLPRIPGIPDGCQRHRIAADIEPQRFYIALIRHQVTDGEIFILCRGRYQLVIRAGFTDGDDTLPVFVSRD